MGPFVVLPFPRFKCDFFFLHGFSISVANSWFLQTQIRKLNSPRALAEAEVKFSNHSQTVTTVACYSALGCMHSDTLAMISALGKHQTGDENILLHLLAVLCLDYPIGMCLFSSIQTPYKMAKIEPASFSTERNSTFTDQKQTGISSIKNHPLVENAFAL